MAVVNGDNKDNDLVATDNPDTINGKGGDDTLVGYAGDDTLSGGSGNDFLNAGYGDNRVNGGSGFDFADLRYDKQGVMVDFSHGQITAFKESDSITSVEGVLTGSGDDTVTAAGAGNEVYLNGGDDRFNGARGDDYANGGVGSDVLNGGQGADTLNGVGGDDKINGGKGYDTADYYYAPNGDLAVQSADVTVSLKSGKATIGGETDRLSGIEQVWTGSGDDRIVGDGRDNSFYSAHGDDKLTGGGGHDRFLFDDSDGVDHVTDFQNKIDRIDLTAVKGIKDVSHIAISQTGDNVTIDYGSGEIVLDAINVSKIGSADFLF